MEMEWIGWMRRGGGKKSGFEQQKGGLLGWATWASRVFVVGVRLSAGPHLAETGLAGVR